MSKENPQLEDGYFKIANDLWDYILRSNISREEFKVVGAIIKQTYGWHKKEAAISYGLFEKITRLDRRNIVRAVQGLLEKDLISRRAGAKLKFGKPVYNYQLNKKGWCQYDNRTIVNRTIEAIVNTTTIKDNKYNIKHRSVYPVDNFQSAGTILNQKYAKRRKPSKP